MRVLKIEEMDDEGRGRALDQGIHYAVRGAFTGDEVAFKEERFFKARRLSVGRVKRYFKKGTHHTPRSCHHRLPCPACPLHDATEFLAHEIKRKRILSALAQAGLNFEVEPVVPHPHILGYRQKVKLMVHGEAGALKLGVYIPYSHDFQEASQCPHVNPAINEAILKLLALLNELRVEGLKAVILRAVDSGVAGVLLTSKLLPEALFERSPLLALQERLQIENSNFLLQGSNGRLMGLAQHIEQVDAFCQTDPVQAQRMYDWVADFLYQGPGLYIDAFAGVGGFSEALKRHGSCELIATESNPACYSALEALGARVLTLPSLAEQKPLGLVLDPPKKGLMQEAEDYASLGAQKVALVSCDPKAMVRDLQVFLAKGYKVERIIPIDLFGGTSAIETVVLLQFRS